MEFTNFESELTILCSKVSELFEELDQLRHDEEKLFIETLDNNSFEKQTFLNQLEVNINEKVENLRINLDELNKEIAKLDINKIPNLHDIEELRNNFNSQKQDALKEEILNIKKKKIDTTHKITALKKDLANYHKENNNKLIEEEKNSRLREAEFDRRLNIDIDREDDANTKRYNDLEKTMLDTNDEVLIRDLHKRIKVIRIEGLENIKKLKDRYAYLRFENSFEFEKFKEKIILDNGIRLEENKVMVHGLETQNLLLDEREELLANNALLETEKELVQFELENELNNNEVRLAMVKEIIRLKLVGNRQAKEAHIIKKKDLDGLTEECFKFDESQLTLILPYLFSDRTKISEFINGLFIVLSNQVKALKDFIFTYLEKLVAERFEDYKRYHNYFSLYSKERLNHTDFEYKDFRKSLEKEINLYHKEQNTQLRIVKNGITSLINNILTEYKKTEKLLLSYFIDVYSIEINHANRVEDIINGVFIDSRNQIAKEDDIFNKNSLNEVNDLKRQEETAIKFYQSSESRIREKYRLKLLEKENDIAENLQSSKNKREKIEADSRDFVAKSRERVNELKQLSAENLQKHEKELHNIYKGTVDTNEAEKKLRAAEL